MVFVNRLMKYYSDKRGRDYQDIKKFVVSSFVDLKFYKEKELVEIFNKLPDDLKEDAYEWGMSDTLWRDKFIEWYEENCL